MSQVWENIYFGNLYDIFAVPIVYEVKTPVNIQQRLFGNGKAWDKTKEVSGDAWDATKEGAAKAKDAITH